MNAEGARKLSEEELFMCLRSLNIPVRVSDIKTPTKEFVIRVFECCLKDVQIDHRSQQLRPWQAIQHIDHPEITEEAITLTALLFCINFITQNDGLLINFKDITEPKPKRTKKILNYLIVFWNFCVTKYALYQAIEESMQEEKETILALSSDIESLEEKYQHMQDALKNMQPSKEELNSEISMKNEEMRNCEIRKETLETDYQNLKKEELDLKNEISAVDIEIIAVKEAISELETHILTSPEKFADGLQKTKELINDEDVKIKAKEAELKEKIKMLEGIKIGQEENIKALELLQKIEVGCGELSNTSKCIVSGVQNYKLEEDQVKELQTELDMDKDVKYSSEEKAVRVQLSIKKQIETLSDTFGNIQRDIEEESRLIEFTKNATHDCNLQGDKEINAVLDIIELCKRAEAETEKEHLTFESQMESILKQFQVDADDVENQVKQYFGF